MSMRFCAAALFAGLTTVSASQQNWQPLLSYLDVGKGRIAYADDTLVRATKRVALTHSSFQSVSGMFGAAKPVTTGDAGDFLRTVCYALSGRQKMILMLESDEMGGGTSLTGFSFLPNGARRSRERGCAQLGVNPIAIVTNTGLKLGLTRREVEARLGLAGRDSAGSVVYEQTLEKQMRTRDGRTVRYDQYAGIRGPFSRWPSSGIFRQSR